MEWFEDDEFWSTFSPYIFSEARLKAAREEAGLVLALARLSQPDVLDLCCGTGRHAVAFARQGCRVTGVDRARAALDQARAHAAAEGADVEFVRCDMRDFTRPASFDLVTNLFTSFGYFEKEDDDLRVLGHMRESLRPGGSIVIDVMGKEILARMFQETRSAVASDGTLCIWRNTVAADWTRINGEWYAVRDGTARRFAVDHWIYSGRELRDLLARAGFSDIRLFGDLHGADYGLGAERLVAVARTAGANARGVAPR